MNFRTAQAANKRRTAGLLIAMFALVSVAVWAAAQLMGVGSALLVPVAITMALVSVWGSYWHSDRLVLAMTHAKVIDHSSAPQLHNMVEELCIASGLPMPKVAIVQDGAPNAFATGRDPQHAVIAFTTGILELMDREQLQGVTAHELAHVANRDTLVSAVAATTAGLLAIISDLGLRMMFLGDRRNQSSNPVALGISLVVILLAPIAAVLLRAAVSRQRESLADATAVALTRNPAGLRRALECLEANTTVVGTKSKSVAHMWIESPLDGKGKALFNTHPPLSKRIDALRQMEHMGPRAGQPNQF